MTHACGPLDKAPTSWFLALVWSGDVLCSHLGNAPVEGKSFSGPLFFALKLSNFQYIPGLYTMAQLVNFPPCKCQDPIWALDCVPAATLPIPCPVCGLGIQ